MKFGALVLGLILGCTSAVVNAQDHKHNHDHDHSHDHDKMQLIRMGTFSLLETSGTVKVENGLKPGKDAGFEVTLTKPEKIAVLRLWIGDERAEATGKSKGEKEGEGAYHVHAEVPEKLTETDYLWVELEDTSDNEVRTSITIPAKFRK